MQFTVISDLLPFNDKTHLSFRCIITGTIKFNLAVIKNFM